MVDDERAESFSAQPIINAPDPEDVELTAVTPVSDAPPSAPPSAPRKVELDIDELPEDLAIEVPETEAPEEAPAEAKPEEAPLEAPVKRSRIKLFLFSGLIGVFLVLLAFSGFMIYRLVHPPQPVRPASLPESLVLKLDPFMVSVSQDSTERLVSLEVALTFSSLDAKAEFLSDQLFFRDRIYRFLLTQNIADLDRQAVAFALQKRIAALVNVSLAKGEVNLVLLEPSKKEEAPV